MPHSTKPLPHPHFFTCTFCWHLSRGPPHVLGRAARLTCEQCYSALIDLAICWVCGEVVYRGSDRIVVQGVKVAELFEDDDESNGGGEQNAETEESATGGRTAKEIVEVPLCANCIVDVDLDSLDQKTVVQKALRRIDKVDGGMSRNRWERREGTISRSATGHIKRVPSQMSRVPEEMATRTRPRSSRLAADGAESTEGESGDDGRNCIVPLDSTIYISILDPMGEPAFKPSPTKPIPRWMQMLPSQRHPQAQATNRPRSLLDEHFRDVRSISVRGISSPESNTICPTSPVEVAPRALSPPRRSRHRPESRDSVSSQHSEFDDLPEISITVPTRGHNISFVTHEPLKRPSSRAMAHTTSEGSGSYASAQEFPSSGPLSESTRARTNKTPFPVVGRSYSPISEHGNDRDASRPRSPHRRSPRLGHRSSSPLAEQVVSHLQRIVRRTPPPQSKEYLNLYKPTQASRTSRTRNVSRESNSIAIAGRRRARQVEQEDLAELLRRNNEKGGYSLEQSEDAVEGRGGETASGQERGLVGKRSSLQAELKRLFGRGGGSG